MYDIDPSEYFNNPKIFFFIVIMFIKTPIFLDHNLAESLLTFLYFIILPFDKIVIRPLLVLTLDFFLKKKKKLNFFLKKKGLKSFFLNLADGVNGLYLFIKILLNINYLKFKKNFKK